MLLKNQKICPDKKSEEGSEMKVTGEYMGKKEEMTLEVVEKEQNKRLVTKQTQVIFQKWESMQEFQSNGNLDTNTTIVNHTVNYKLPTIGKIANVLTVSQAENKIREGIVQAS